MNATPLRPLVKVCLRSIVVVLGCLLTAGVLHAGSGRYADTDPSWFQHSPVLFTDVTEPAQVGLVAPQFGAVWGDYDADGYEDLYVGNHFYTANLYRNSGDGTFVDLRAEAGIKAGPSDWHGAAWGDYNGDGALDLIVVTGGSIPDGSDLYMNDRGGGFAELALVAGVQNVTGRGRAPRWVDYDLDGDLDLFIANDKRETAPNRLYRNEGDGTFTDVAGQAGLVVTDGTRGAAWADYDGDGYPDLALAMVSCPFKLFSSRGNGTWVETTHTALPDAIYARSVAWGDYDNDADLDLYMSLAYNDYMDRVTWDANTIEAVVDVVAGQEEGLDLNGALPSITLDLWLADRRLRPREVSYGATNQHPAAVPFTLDETTQHIGHPSYIPGQDAGVFVWRDSADGPWHIRWSGKEWYVARISTGGEFEEVSTVGFDTPFQPSRANRLYRNRGDGTFERVEQFAGVGDPSNSHDAQWVDVDNDGYLDLYVTNFGDTVMGDQQNRVYLNRGDGTFSDVTAASQGFEVVPGNQECSAWADYDNDGDLDVFVQNSSYNGYLAGPHKMYRNAGNDNHWLQIGLRGTRSNRLGIGAQVQVAAGELTQFREVGAGSSSACQNSLLAHFGLGPHAVAETITVTWPSGSVQVLHDIPADRTLQIVEDLETDLAIVPPDFVPEHVWAGDALTYTVRVANLGPAPLVTATLTAAVDVPDAIAGVASPGCEWLPGVGQVTCLVSDIALGAPVDRDLVLLTSGAYSGTLHIATTVAPIGGDLDPNTLNNSLVWTTFLAIVPQQPGAEGTRCFLPLLLYNSQ